MITEGEQYTLPKKVCVCPCIAHASNANVHTCDLCAQSANQSAQLASVFIESCIMKYQAMHIIMFM